MSDDALGLTAELNVPFGEAIERTKQALKAEGFGVISEIDMEAAFREKLGRAFRPFVILGACNPPLAFDAMTRDPEVGLLLPCNVTVEAVDEQRSIVRIIDPIRLLAASALSALPDFAPIARDAHERLARVAGVLRAET